VDVVEVSPSVTSTSANGKPVVVAICWFDKPESNNWCTSCDSVGLAGGRGVGAALLKSDPMDAIPDRETAMGHLLKICCGCSYRHRGPAISIFCARKSPPAKDFSPDRAS
jgi:hypothetical protein